VNWKKSNTLIIKNKEMPNRDGSGPEGKGAKTGRGMGGCRPEKDIDKLMRSREERGQGRGQSQGRGRR